MAMAMTIRTRFPGGLLQRSNLTSIHSTSIGSILTFSPRTSFQQPSVSTSPAQALFYLTRTFTTSLRVDKEELMLRFTPSADEKLFWTEEEDRIIKNFYLAGVSTREIQQIHLPHRTESAIQSRRITLTPPKKKAKTKPEQWTEEEDQLLQRLHIEEGWGVGHIRHRFPLRTSHAISCRGSKFKAIQGKFRKVNWSEEELARLMEFVRQNNWFQAFQSFPDMNYFNIRSRYTKYRKERFLESASDENGQGTTDASASVAVALPGRRHLHKPMTSDGEKLEQDSHDRWTPEQDAALVKCVEATPKGLSRYWTIISERLKEEPGWSETLARNRGYERYRLLSLRNKGNNGRWDEVEVRKLEAAVQEQIGTGYELIADVLKKDSVKAKTQNDDGFRYPKVGSKEMKSVRWVEVAKKVGTRTAGGCRKRFYSYHHSNNATGRWSQGEIKKLLKGQQKFGNDFDAISGYVGTRGRKQVVDKLARLARNESSRVEST